MDDYPRTVNVILGTCLGCGENVTTEEDHREFMDSLFHYGEEKHCVPRDLLTCIECGQLEEIRDMVGHRCQQCARDICSMIAAPLRRP